MKQSLRYPMLALCAALALGCSAASEDKGSEITPGSVDLGKGLRVEGRSVVRLLPSGTVRLRVRYYDADGAPIDGDSIEFGLSEDAPGASLFPAQTETDEAGYAETELRVGSSETSFQVRASALGVEPVFFDVSVGQALAPQVSVAIRYDGKRSVVASSVALLTGMTCADVSGASTRVDAGTTQVAYRADQTIDFPLVGGISYTFVAWGRDDTNSTLAFGCAETVAPITAEPDEARFTFSLPITDVPLRARGGSYPVTFDVNVSSALLDLQAIAEDTVEAQMPSGDTASATFYLDALEASLSGTDLATFANTRETRGLDRVLQMSLAGSGAAAFAREVAGALATDFRMVSLEGTYRAASSSDNVNFIIQQASVLGEGRNARQIPLTGESLSGAALTTARYDESLASIVVDSLDFKLGLGSYATFLLDSLQADPAALGTRFEAVHGCSAVAELVAQNAGLVLTPMTALSRCQQAALGVLPGVRSAFQGLDAEQGSIMLDGALSVHDRDGDGNVDDLGPGQLFGSWGMPTRAPARPTVSATLRISAAAALAL